MSVRFDGTTFVQELDGARLESQLEKVFNFMQDGQWHTLAIIAAAVKAGESSVSARLRDLRKKRFGEHTIERHSLGEGLFMYRMILNDK